MTQEFIKSQNKSRTGDRIGVWTVWFILSNDSLPANQLLLLTSIINRQWLCFWHRDWSTKENYFWKILFLYICQKEIKNSIKSLLFLFLFNFVWVKFELWRSMWINVLSLYIRKGNIFWSLVLWVFCRECEQSSFFLPLKGGKEQFSCHAETWVWC